MWPGRHVQLAGSHVPFIRCRFYAYLTDNGPSLNLLCTNKHLFCIRKATPKRGTYIKNNIYNETKNI